MRTHLEFRSAAFPALPEENETVNPGRFGKRLAEFLAAGLPGQGIAVTGFSPEDWGWRIDLANAGYPLWIGCGNYDEYEDGFLCFIDPSKPFIRKFLTKVSTVETVERVAAAMQAIFESSAKVREMRWWATGEA